MQKGILSDKSKSAIFALAGVFCCVVLLICISAVRRFWEGQIYSVQSGFYDEPFDLSFFSFPGVHYYYTLDGTEPTTDSDEYHEAIHISDASRNENKYAAIEGMSGYWEDYFPDYLIDKATVVKSIAVFRDHISKVFTGVYFVGYQEKDGYDGMKIMSMVVDPDDLFSDEGIYVVGKLAGDPDPNETYSPGSYPANYNIESKDMRCPAHIILWDSDRTKLADEDLSIGIHGGWSKSFLQKSFNLYSDHKKGSGGLDLGEYMLRTSGYRDTFQTMFRDVLNQELVADRDVATQSASPCILFINGEYWGVYNLQQRYNEAFFENEYRISKDNLIVMKKELVSSGQASDQAYYDELIQFAVEHDLSLQENYDTISEMMDIQSFIDYNCAECYIANMDWPINNACCFRSRKIISDETYEDGRWRWALFDTDDSVNVNLQYPVMGRTDSNPFTYEAHWAGNPAETELMLALRQNDSFCKQFADTFIEMAETNFDYASVSSLLTEYASLYRVPMVMTQHRFSTMSFTEDTFDAYVSNMDEFFKNRMAYVVPYMEEVFLK